MEANGTMKAQCEDCAHPYGEDGWCDVVVPNDIWNQIAPDTGLLCFRCMTKRIEAHGLMKVPVIVASGPYRDANEEWRLIGWQHGYDVAKFEVESLFAEIERLMEERKRMIHVIHAWHVFRGEPQHCECDTCTEYRTLKQPT